MEHPDEPEATPTLVKACRNWLHPLFALTALACLLSLVGWTGRVTDFQHWLTVAVGLAFAAERLVIFQALRNQRAEKRRLTYHAGLAVVVLVATAILVFHPWPGGWNSVWHRFVLTAVLVSGFASVIHHQGRLTARAFHPGMVMMGSFLAIIAIGTLLLKMPRCTVSGVSCSWLDAVFTSTSATCVTGLAVQNTATYFSPTGQAVILLLIQIGGLGVMTLTFFAAVVFAEGISLHDRLLLGRMLQENRLARVGRTISFIVALTFLCEAVGAVVLYAGLDPVLAPERRWFHAVFHSVSAFCNAGFSTLPDGLASAPVHGNLVWQVMIMLLIVIGGLGALPCEDLSLWSVAKFRRLRRCEGPRPRLRVHTRLVLLVTGLLLAGGTAVFYLTEFVFHDGLQNGGQLITALFHSVTARTAGFNTVPMINLGTLTIPALIVLMLIGGSPGGTAGGLRTTTVAVGLGHLWNQLRGGTRGMVVFHRTIPAATGARALGLIVLAFLWLGANFVVLQFLETGRGHSETGLMFELVSAFATVGLSIDLTGFLTDGSKALLVLNMFTGRIGLLAVLATLIPPDRRPASGKPQEDILLT